jgi:arachidonate 5-lipoxygenase
MQVVFYLLFMCRLGVTEEMLKPFLEGWSLQQVLDAKRLFIVDHKILEGLPCRDGFSVSIEYLMFFLSI